MPSKRAVDLAVISRKYVHLASDQVRVPSQNVVFVSQIFNSQGHTIFSISTIPGNHRVDQIKAGLNKVLRVRGVIIAVSGIKPLQAGDDF